MQIERGARAGIEGPAVIHNPQDDLTTFDGEFDVDQVRVGIDIGVTHHVRDQFVDHQIHSVCRSVGHAMTLEELGQRGVEAFEFREFVLDRQLQLAFYYGEGRGNGL